MTTCRSCQFGSFQLTPTGRIKTKLSGKCLKADQVVKSILDSSTIPCVTVEYVRQIAIWSDTNADNCGEYKAARAKP